MLCQTIDELLPLLEMLPHAAFCLRKDGSIVPNHAAKHTVPQEIDEFKRWLGDSAAVFDSWDRTGTMKFSVQTADRAYTAALCPVQDGVLCLLQEISDGPVQNQALSVASQVLRMPLATLSAHVQQLAESTEEQALLAHTAAMQRQLYRLSRIAANLSDLDLMSRNQYPLHLQLLNTLSLKNEPQQELTDLLRECGRTLIWDVPQKALAFVGDKALINRAILNLVSNALKFSPAETPVTLRICDLTDRLLVQVENSCTEDAAILLRGAFDRLQQRGPLPDPRWGVGLGLPLTAAIARAHGGTTAFEIKDRTVTVTFSLSRHRSTELPVVKAPSFSYSGGLRQTLFELSDCLPNSVYHRDAL